MSTDAEKLAEAMLVIRGLLATGDHEFPNCDPWLERADKLLGETVFHDAFHCGNAPEVSHVDQ